MTVERDVVDRIGTDGAYRHREAEPSPIDRGFGRAFLTTAAVLVALLGGVNMLVDPLGAFGTGLLPPAISRDRDFKAVHFRRNVLPPEIVVIGSSRVQRFDPACIQALTGRPAFNFGVTAGSTADYLAILRYMRDSPVFRVRQILVGVEPETFQGSEGIERALNESRLLRRFVPDSSPPPWTLGADLLGWQSLGAALSSIGYALFGKASTTEHQRDGFPIGRVTVPRLQPTQVLKSVPSILTRYAFFPRLEPTRVAYLRTFLEEARSAGIEVFAFIPPVHPALTRAAEGSGLPDRTAETVALLEELEREGLLRYVETRDLATFGGDPIYFFDAIHMMPENSFRLLAYLYGQPGGCALQ